MTGVDTDLATLRDYAGWATTPASHKRAVKGVEAELSRLGALYSCSYATGRGQNCGKCQQCLLVHEHFLKKAYEQQKAELSRLRELCVAIDTGTFDTQRERAEAAEAELSRLHDHRDYDVWNERILRRAAEARLGEARQECARLDADRRTAMAAAERFREQGIQDAARCARLQQERDALIERDFWASQTIREQEAELVRLREMLARVRPDIDPETGYGRVEAI